MLNLSLTECSEVVKHHIGLERHAPELPLVNIANLFRFFVVLLDIDIEVEVCKELIIFLGIRVLLHQELLFEFGDVGSHLDQHTVNTRLIVRQVVDEDSLLLLITIELGLLDFGSVAASRRLLSLLFLFEPLFLVMIDDTFRFQVIERCLF